MADVPTYTTALVPANTMSVGRGAVSGAYATLMQLTTDAVLIFDCVGRVLACNAQASQLSGYTQEALLSKGVTELFYRPERPGSATTNSSTDAGSAAVGNAAASTAPGEFPFSVDGSLSIIWMHLAQGGAAQVSLRADRVSAPGETYLLTAKPFDVPSELEQEHDRLVDELALANRRLSGTLKIVLDTIDVANVPALFEEVLFQISETLEASGAVLFLAKNSGYRLWGTTPSLEGRRVPHYMSYRDGLAPLIARTGAAMRLHLAAPTEKNLRAGALSSRVLIDDETGKSYRIPANQVPPFVSLICVPIWFDGRVIAIIEVGWAEQRPTRKDDARLLDTIAQYLSVEFAAAIATMRTEKTQRLDALAMHLHDELENNEEAAQGNLAFLAKEVAENLQVTIAPVRVGAHGEASIINLPTASQEPLDFTVIGGAPEAPAAEDVPVLDGIEFPLSLDEYVAGKQDQGIAVVRIPRVSKLACWLSEQGCSNSGVIFDIGKVAGIRRTSLLLRSENLEPLDDTELDFLRRVAIDIAETAQAKEQRSKDTHISQALQNGMRNELQHVDGITASGLYSSATAAALVGGDFYDLIALPNRRACVILGDVSGKGVEAASVSAAVKTALGAYAWEGQAPARMVRLLNDFLLGFSRLETFATLFVGMIDLSHGQLTYCSAGHPPAIFWHADTNEMQTLDEQSGVVGAFKGMTYHDGHVSIKQGDGLLLYTDGVTEARSSAGAFFGEDGLHDAVMAEIGYGIEKLPQNILARLDAFTSRSLEDDVAMVSLRFDEVGK